MFSIAASVHAPILNQTTAMRTALAVSLICLQTAATNGAEALSSTIQQKRYAS
jgi:hypothetical protein